MAKEIRFAGNVGSLARLLYWSRPRRRRGRPGYGEVASVVAAEVLERRVMLTAPAPGAGPPAAEAESAQDSKAVVEFAAPSLAEITDVAVNEVRTVTNDLGEITGLVANATISGTLLGQDFSETVDIPLSLTTSDDSTSSTPILSLSLGPVHLDVLGFQVDLDNCEGGPITVNITAEEGGGLLGDLLSDLAGLLDDGLSLGDVLEGLDDIQLDELLTDLEGVLDGVLGSLTDGAGGLLESHQNDNGHGGKTCDVLSLSIEDGVHLDLLGLNVDTSGICLDVTAERGSGNLVGNLVCSVTHLLDNGNPNAIEAVFSNFDRRLAKALDRL